MQMKNGLLMNTNKHIVTKAFFHHNKILGKQNKLRIRNINTEIYFMSKLNSK